MEAEEKAIVEMALYRALPAGPAAVVGAVKYGKKYRKYRYFPILRRGSGGVGMFQSISGVATNRGRGREDPFH